MDHSSVAITEKEILDMARKKIKGKLVKLLDRSSAKLVGAIEGLVSLETIVAPSIRKHLRAVAKGTELVMKSLELLVPPKKRKTEKKGGKKKKNNDTDGESKKKKKKTKKSQ